MGIPRWVLILGIVLAIIWLINDPAGMGHFFNHAATSIGIFFKNLG